MKSYLFQESHNGSGFRIFKLMLEIFFIIVSVEVPIMYFLPLFASDLSWIAQTLIDALTMAALSAPLIVWRLWRAIMPQTGQGGVGSARLGVASEGSSVRPVWILSISLAIGFVCLAVTMFSTIDRIKIGGQMYTEIIEQKDLVADILPPPMYAIESYLTVLELASPMRSADHDLLEANLRRMEEEYESRHTYWSSVLRPGPVKKLLVETSSEPARRFFKICREQLIPLIDSRDFQRAQELIHGELRGAYVEHRSAIDELTIQARARALEVEENAAKTLSWGFIPVLLAVTAFLLVTTLVVIVWNFSNARRKAEAMATSMTAELRAKTDQLVLTERKSRALFDQTFQLTSLLDVDGRVLDVNKTALDFANLGLADVLSKPFWATPWCVPSDSLIVKVKDAIARAGGGELVRFESQYPTEQGLTKTIDFSIKPVLDENGDIVWLVLEGRDISERKQFEDDLTRAKLVAESANQSKSEFLANMSHEIRTPMTAILGFTDLLLEERNFQNDPERRIQAVQTIQRNGEHLLGIINDILDLAKIESGKLEVDSVPYSPISIIEGVLSLMRVRSGAKGLTLESHFETAVPSLIMTDPIRLRQVILNLVSNAIKFTDQGSVRVIIRYVPGEVAKMEFDVEDTGMGLSLEQRERLFKPFTQADTSTTRQFGGTGLGLTICKRLSEMMGGDVFIARSSPGEGSCFRAVIQVGSGDARSMQGVEMIDMSQSKLLAAVPNGRGQGLPTENALVGMRILLAEDGPDNQRLISFVLRKAGAVVSIVGNGQLAAEAALEAHGDGKPFHVLLMDMQMPVLDGYGAVALLRAKGYRGHIIALTAHAMNSDREKCINAGCDDFATKPIDRVRLFEQIAAARPKAPLVPQAPFVPQAPLSSEAIASAAIPFDCSLGPL